MTDKIPVSEIAPKPKPHAVEGSDGLAKTPAPTKPVYKVAEVRDDGVAVLSLEDGRMITAELPEGIDVRKGTVVDITSDGEDKGGAPTNAKITKAH